MEKNPLRVQTGHGPETAIVWSHAQSFFWPHGDLGSSYLVGWFYGQVAAQNGNGVVWLQPKISFWLPLPFSGEVTSDQ
jgi:hypothetical protein